MRAQLGTWVDRTDAVKLQKKGSAQGLNHSSHCSGYTHAMSAKKSETTAGGQGLLQCRNLRGAAPVRSAVQTSMSSNCTASETDRLHGDICNRLLYGAARSWLNRALLEFTVASCRQLAQLSRDHDGISSFCICPPSIREKNVCDCQPVVSSHGYQYSCQ